MERLFALVPVALMMLWTGASALGQEAPPAWAYPVNPPGFKAPPDDGTPRRVPDSDLTLTLTQVRDRFFSPDWHPGDHPPQPEVVAHGRKPDVLACGFCHRADGPGGPESANLMGLPAPYIKQQIADFKSGTRKSSVMNRAPMALKMAIVKAVTDEEIALAANYFSSLRPRSVIRVTESAMVPKTVVAGWFLIVDNTGGTEPIGDRIIEIADDLGRFVSRDARVTFTANVPPGSIQKGQALAAPCKACHGADLKGIGSVPGIAGRSPTYIFRQLYDYKRGVRAGAASAQMTPSVQNLTTNDMIGLAAYAASLKP
jgi:cytochrome c553